MTTLTASSGTVSLTSATGWSPSQIPAAGDDLVVGAATLTLDTDMVGAGRLGSVTFNSVSSRLAVSGTPRTVEAANGWIITAGLTDRLLTGLFSSGELTLGGTWYFTSVSNNNARIVDGSGGDVTLRTIGSDPTALLFYAPNAYTMAYITRSWSVGTLRTIGLFDLNGTLFNYAQVIISSGVWYHESVGVNRFANYGKIVTASGTAHFEWTGDVEVGQISVASPFSISGSATGVIGETGNYFKTLGNQAGQTNPLIMNTGNGIVDLIGKPVTSSGVGSTPLAGTGPFRWRNQNVSINDGEEVLVYLYSGGSIDVSGLVVANSGKFCIAKLYNSAIISDGDTLITNQTTSAQACVIGSDDLDSKIITLESDPPTLPDKEDVAAGTTYGYSESPLTGTGLIVDPAILAAAITPLFTEIKGVGWSSDTDTLEKIRDTSNGIRFGR